MGRVRRLIEQRDRVRAHFLVEPFPVPWRAIRSTLFPDALDEQSRGNLAVRGGLDDWWQCQRPPGPKGPPEAPDGLGERGYLEVVL